MPTQVTTFSGICQNSATAEGGIAPTTGLPAASRPKIASPWRYCDAGEFGAIKDACYAARGPNQNGNADARLA